MLGTVVEKGYLNFPPPRMHCAQAATRAPTGIHRSYLILEMRVRRPRPPQARAEKVSSRELRQKGGDGKDTVSLHGSAAHSEHTVRGSGGRKFLLELPFKDSHDFLPATPFGARGCGRQIVCGKIRCTVGRISNRETPFLTFV